MSPTEEIRDGFRDAFSASAADKGLLRHPSRQNRRKELSMSQARKIATAGMLSAMCAVLGYISVDFANLRFTFVSFPIYIGAFLLGAPSGFLIGFVGNFIYQLLKYGLTATTALWIIPYALAGLAAGSYARLKHYRMSTAQTVLVLISCELMISVLNTISFFFDAKIYGYYNPVTMLGAIPPRFIISIIRALIYAAVVPGVLHAVRRIVRGSLSEGKS